MLSKADITSLVNDEMLPDWRNERERLDRIDRWYRRCPERDEHDIRLPHGATRELRALVALSRTPWLGLVVASTAQCMYVDGYRSELDEPSVDDVNGSERTPWRYWLANHWDYRQLAVHRAMLAYGYAYATCLPGQDFRGEPMPVLRGVSPMKMWATYEDPAEDDWPRYALHVLSKPDEQTLRVRLFDDELVYGLTIRTGVAQSEDPVTVDSLAEHGAGVTPVVRYCHGLDLNGRSVGEVEPYIPLAARINKTSYDRMMTQHFNSWKVRWVSGMAEPDVEEEANRTAMRMRQDDILIAEDPDTKFGTLDETQLQGFIAAHRADVETLAAVSQTPTHELTGQMANLSAEALAAARASQTQKVTEVQHGAGKGHGQLLRLAAHTDGDTKYAEDVTGRVTWQDTSIRSLAQSIDALGKAAQMLQVPPTALWPRIPGITKSDVEEWVKLARQDDPLNRMQEALDRQASDAMGTARDMDRAGAD